jgi:hypothetical protein
MEENMLLMYRRPMFAIGAALFAIVATLTSTATPASADGFRIETKVFVGEEEAPVSESTTLFSSGVVYDFLKQSEQTAIFRKPITNKPGRFILLSAKKGVSTEIPTDKLTGAMDKVRTWASQQSDPFLKFAANPEFEETFEPDTGKLVLASHFESYSVATTRAEHPDAMNEYREFLDWYTQLNTLLTSHTPPDPRLHLNAALARRNALPTTVELTRAGNDEPLRAEHDFTWRLSQDDKRRIEDVRAALSSYRKVDNDEFRRLTRDEPDDK